MYLRGVGGVCLRGGDWLQQNILELIAGYVRGGVRCNHHGWNVRVRKMYASVRARTTS